MLRASAPLQDPERLKDPVEFVQQLLDLKDKFDAIVTRSFSNDKSFQNALNQVPPLRRHLPTACPPRHPFLHSVEEIQLCWAHTQRKGRSRSGLSAPADHDRRTADEACLGAGV